MAANTQARQSPESNPAIEAAGHPAADSTVRRGIWHIAGVVLVIILLVAVIGLVWQSDNRQRAAALSGQWYCIDDGMLYVFDSDGGFTANIGKIAILSGSWQAGWRRGVVRITYTKDDQARADQVAYELTPDSGKLVLTGLDDQVLTMNRQNPDA